VGHGTVYCEGQWWVMGQCIVRVTGGSWDSVVWESLVGHGTV
jgi:hypothetical protein